MRAKSGSIEATVGSVAQSRRHATAWMSGLAVAPKVLPGHKPWLLRMPLRLGSRACTSFMLRCDSTKSSGTTPPRWSMNAVTAYTSSGLSDLGAFQGIARLM